MPIEVTNECHKVWITPLSVKGEGEGEGGGWTEPGQIYVHTYQGIGRVNIKIEIHTEQSSCQILSSNITTPHALRWADGNQTQCFVIMFAKSLKTWKLLEKKLEKTWKRVGRGKLKKWGGVQSVNTLPIPRNNLKQKAAVTRTDLCTKKRWGGGLKPPPHLPRITPISV